MSSLALHILSFNGLTALMRHPQNVHYLIFLTSMKPYHAEHFIQSTFALFFLPLRQRRRRRLGGARGGAAGVGRPGVDSVGAGALRRHQRGFGTRFERLQEEGKARRGRERSKTFLCLAKKFYPTQELPKRITTDEEKEVLSLLCKVHELEIEKVRENEAHSGPGR